MEKSLTLIAGSEETRKTLTNQLLETIENININSFSTDENKDITINDKVVVLSSKSIKQELKDKEVDLNNKIVIVANRTINYDYIDSIVLLPDNTDVLLVSDSEESCIDCIKSIKDLEIEHLNIYNYYPGKLKKHEDITIAITPGEVDKVPNHIEKVYNISSRIIDFSTIIDILDNLKLTKESYNEISNNYLMKIVNVSKRLSQANKSLMNINDNLNTIITQLDKGYLLFEPDGQVRAINDKLKNILNLKEKYIVGNNIKDLIKNKNILEFIENDNSQEIKQFKDIHKILNIQKLKIHSKNLNLCVFEYIGEDSYKSELLNKKGLIAKYTMDDIIGNSEAINKVKYISNKLANTDLTILIEGESGTGKELFASAIHMNSNRKKGPFLAVNASSLPEELLESQLFGYEEGSFTGAKKGGSKGLFEQAHKGTIFLDEIGDISKKLQARLLRVLQEKEIMRVGGNEIINVDVRVIAATNKNLQKLVYENKFREDLYYRLKIGYIKIPPLRDRKEDIEDLLKYFIHCETNEKIFIDDSSIEILNKYDWLGNVRELRNTVNYMIAVKESNIIKLRDLPEYILQNNKAETIEYKVYDKIKDEKMEFILKNIYDYNLRNEVIGREIILEESIKNNIDMTLSQIRTKLNKLEKLEYITKHKGKVGTKITQKGKIWCESLMEC